VINPSVYGKIEEEYPRSRVPSGIPKVLPFHRRRVVEAMAEEVFDALVAEIDRVVSSPYPTQLKVSI